MKLHKIAFTIFIIFITSCGSGERVITDDGKIYTVKGNTITNKDIDVTENLSDDRRDKIQELVAEKEEAREELEKRQQELEEKKEAQEKIEKEAQERQKEIEEKQEALEKTRKEKQEAREDYVEAKNRLDEQKEEYELLKEKGELSPRDEGKWQKKFKSLKKDVRKAKNKLDKID
jgi:DNA repair exonuclease SbcCD ATPase subunit